MAKISIVLGTRPEAIKLLPLYKRLLTDDFFDVTLISTGQHREMLQSVFEFFEVKPDINLDLMTSNQTLASLTSLALTEIDKCLIDLEPELVIVQGDTTTAMITGLSAYYNQIKVAHVEAGLRTYDKYSPFPEEINRRIIGQIADFNFAPTSKAYDNLVNEQLGKAWNVGNTVIDSLLYTKEKVEASLSQYESKFSTILNKGRENILITGHRRESFGKGFEEICKAIKDLATLNPSFNFVYPVHLNPNVKNVVHQMLSSSTNIHLIEPLPYDELIFLIMRSKLILTDSGGIQEEAPSLNVPVIVMRNHTERPEGIEAGCSVLAGTEANAIVGHFTEIINNQDLYLSMSNAINPYGDGNTSDRIANILKDSL